MRLKGHSLIETLVSLALLGLVFMLGMTLVGRLMGPSSTPQRFQARSLVQSWLHEPVGKSALATESREVKSFRLERNLMPYSKDAKLLELRVTCYRNEKKVTEASRLVLAP